MKMFMDVMIADTSVPTQWIVLSVACLGVGIVLFKPKFLRATRDPLARSPQSSTLAQHRSVEREMQNLLVELSEMSRQVTASLDTRAAKLDLLIREADEKIAKLTALQNGDGHAETSEARHDLFAERAVQRATGVSAAQSPAMPSAADMPPSAQASAYDVDPRHLEVYQMADQGLTSAEISAQLQRPSGEIQLILALRA